MLTFLVCLFLIVGALSVIAQEGYYVNDSFYNIDEGSPWRFQHALIGKEEYNDLSFIETGWFSEFYQNWAQGAVQKYEEQTGELFLHAGMSADAVITFLTPKSGNICIPTFTITRESALGDGISLQILKNDIVLYPLEEDWLFFESIAFSHEVPDIYLKVQKGDSIRIRINARGNQNNDVVKLKNYHILYLSDTMYEDAISLNKGVVYSNTLSSSPYKNYDSFDALDSFGLENGSTPWSFQYSPIGEVDYFDLEFIDSGWYHSFYQNWSYGSIPRGYVNSGKQVEMHAGQRADSVITFQAPQGGNIQIPAFNVKYLGSSGDGIGFQIMKNEEIIFPLEGSWQFIDKTDTIVSLPDILMAVEKGDKIRFRVNMRSNMIQDSVALVNYGIKYVSAEKYFSQLYKKKAILVDKEPVCFPQIIATKQKGGEELSLSCFDVFEGRKLLVCENDKMQIMKVTILDSSIEEQKVVLSVPLENVVVMLWDGLENIHPLCSPVVFKM